MTYARPGKFTSYLMCFLFVFPPANGTTYRTSHVGGVELLYFDVATVHSVRGNLVRFLMLSLPFNGPRARSHLSDDSLGCFPPFTSGIVLDRSVNCHIVKAVPKTKIVRCCLCRGMMRVSARALSVFCPHCQKRISLENLRIVGSHPGKVLATCGDILIESTARLNVSLVGTNIAINGRVKGAVQAEETVDVGTKGHVIGDITAAKILVQDGGKIEGRCQMVVPKPLSKLEDDPLDEVDSSSDTIEEASGDPDEANEASTPMSQDPHPPRPRPLRPGPRPSPEPTPAPAEFPRPRPLGRSG